MKIRTWFINRFLVLIFGLSVLTLPVVAADDFASEADEWSSSDDKPRKKSKKKAKQGRKSKEKSKESEAVEAEKVNAAVCDRQLWEKMQSVRVKTVNFSGGRVSEYIRFFKAEAAKNGLEVTITYLPADKGDATIIAGDTKGPVSELSFPSIMLADVNLAEVLEVACERAGGQYLVENNEIKIIHNTHYISRTYSVTKAELEVRDDITGSDDEEEFLCDEEDALGAILLRKGVLYLQGAKVSFKNGDKQLVYVAPVQAHEAMVEYEKNLVQLRQGLPKAATYFKKYCATLHKIEKTCERLPGESAKKIESKLKSCFKQLGAACPDSMVEQMEYYVRINPREKSKMNKQIEGARDAIQLLIDECYDRDDEENAELAENLRAYIRRLEN